MLANEKATPPRGNAKSKSKNSLLETIINSLEDDKAPEQHQPVPGRVVRHLQLHRGLDL